MKRTFFFPGVLFLLASASFSLLSRAEERPAGKTEAPPTAELKVPSDALPDALPTEGKNGKETEAKAEDAVKKFQKMLADAEAGDAEAQFQVAWLFLNGEGTAPNPEEAAKWYRKAADQGHTKAQVAMGWAFLSGTMGLSQDEAEAKKWCLKAAEQNDARGQHALGLMAIFSQNGQKDYAEAVKWFRLAAEQNHANAQAFLGICFLYGIGKDAAEAVRWLKSSAELGDPEGQKYLAYCYLQGLGVPKDETLAREWLRVAAMNGTSPSAQEAKYLLQQLEAVGIRTQKAPPTAGLGVSEDGTVTETIPAQETVEESEALPAELPD